MGEDVVDPFPADAKCNSSNSNGVCAQINNLFKKDLLKSAYGAQDVQQQNRFEIRKPLYTDTERKSVVGTSESFDFFRLNRSRTVMKKVWIGLTATAVMLAGVQLAAQSSKPVSFGIAAGAAIPIGDFSNGYDTGYNGTVALGISSVGTPLGLRFEGVYNKFPGKGNQPDARIIDGTANLVYSLPGQGITPYVIGGVGYYSLKVDVPSLDAVNKFGLNGGVGALFPLSGFSAYVEARLHHVFTDVSSTQFIPVTFGVMF